MTTQTLYAPSNAPYATFFGQSGTKYKSDANGMIAGVSAQDVGPLVSSGGCQATAATAGETVLVSSPSALTLTATPMGNVYDVTLTQNTVLTLAGGAQGLQESARVYLRQGGSGGYTPTLPAGVKWAGGTAPTPNSTAGKIDVFTFTTPDGGTTWFGA